MDLFNAILKNANTKNTWSQWVATSSDPAAASTRECLHTCFSGIPSGRRRDVLKKLRTGDVAEVEATLHHLVAHELLRRLNLDPEWEPDIGDLTPDLAFRSSDIRFIGEVFVTHSPARTLVDYSDGTGEAWDTSKPSESRAKKIADRLEEKIAKYKRLNEPLVLFAFLGDHRILRTSHFENALYGRTAGEAEPGEYFPEVGRAPIRWGGILLPQNDGQMPHEHLSAVVVLDWFDTRKSNDPGKRLHALVLHHWAPTTLLSPKVFEPFCQLIWKGQYLRWSPSYTKDQPIVAKFLSNDDLKFSPYSVNNPW